MQEKSIDYPRRYQQAVVGMLRELLSEVAEEGLPGAHHFYITFSTQAPGVEISPALIEHYPDAMTIVLQNQFWGLTVDQEGFSVTLRFGGSPEQLFVPWPAVVAFADPSAEFGLQFQPSASGPEAEAPEGDSETADEERPDRVSGVLEFKKR